MRYQALAERAERLGLPGDEVLHRYRNESGTENFSTELFLFICLEMLAERIKKLEGK